MFPYGWPLVLASKSGGQFLLHCRTAKERATKHVASAHIHQMFERYNATHPYNSTWLLTLIKRMRKQWIPGFPPPMSLGRGYSWLYWLWNLFTLYSCSLMLHGCLELGTWCCAHTVQGLAQPKRKTYYRCHHLFSFHVIRIVMWHWYVSFKPKTKTW